MAGRKFGTDGVRGPANVGLLTPSGAVRLGEACANLIQADGLAPRALIASDTRLSCDMLVDGLSAGLMGGGVDVVKIGVAPTAALGVATAAQNAGLGLMVSASHNPASDNGVKVFAGGGGKLDDGALQRLERSLDAEGGGDAGAAVGRSRQVDDPLGAYRQAVLNAGGGPGGLSGLSIVLDAANGAGSKIAPDILKALGVQTQCMFCEADGAQINAGCGAVHPEALAEAVKAKGADAGLALDGDADRIVLVDETGAVLDGDQILALLAEDAKARGALAGSSVVGTVMCNSALERHLSTLGLSLIRTPVGDRFVATKLSEIGANVGGEPSGHVLLTDYAPSGDGLLAGVAALQALKRYGGPASGVFRRFAPDPSVLINVKAQRARAADQDVAAAVARAEADMGETGRVLVRPSGTEPLVRVLVECMDRDIASRHAQAIADVIAKP